LLCQIVFKTYAVDHSKKLLNKKNVNKMEKLKYLLLVAMIAIVTSCGNQSPVNNKTEEVKQDKVMKDSMNMDTTMNMNSKQMDSMRKK
jgi:hypothetical protein